MSVFASQWEPYGPGRRAPIGALLPASLKARLQAYRRNVAKRYRFVQVSRVEDLIPDKVDLSISTKVDGELWYLCKLADEVALCSPTGRVIQGIPLTDEAAQHLAAVGDIVVAGELFALPGANERARVKAVARAHADGNLAARLGFKVFDVVSDGEDDAQRLPYAARWERIQALFGSGRRVAPVTTVPGGRDAVHQRFAEWVDSGKFEGLVVRVESDNTVFKVKNTLDLDAVVLGFGEARAANDDGTVHAEVRELLVGLVRDDGSYHVLGTVGSGLSAEKRIYWLHRLEPSVVPSQFRMASAEGTLCRWVRPEIVVQLKVFEVIDTDARDQPIRRMVVRFDPQGGWTPVGLDNLASMLFPVFERERPDKPVDAAHVGVEQVYSLIAEGPSENAVATTPQGGRVVARRVWTKVTKGSTAVRKVVVVDPQRGGIDSEYPAFVAHFTDWSHGRKEPLQTQLRVAADREGIDRIVEAWIAENVKKGWAEVP